MMEATTKLAWITGANGLIGSYLVRTAPQFSSQYRARGLTRADFDLLDFDAVERAFHRERPQLLIHCAAITNVAEAQQNPALTRRVNLELTQFLAGLAAGIPLIFFSTDLVFDGRRGNYTELDVPRPLHEYGATKLAAEAAVLRNPRHLVVRTSINGGISASGQRAFNEQLRRSLLSAASSMTLFADEFRCPLPAVETARAVWDLAGKQCTGLYHVAGAEKLSRVQIGELLLRRWPDVTASFKSGSARDFPGPPRALDTSFNIAKAQSVLTEPLPGLTDWLEKHRDDPF